MNLCRNPQCDIPVTAKRNKYCSKSCAAKVNNTFRKDNSKYSLCKGCGIEVFRKIYCKTECRQDHEIDLWLNGELDGCWTYTYASYVRRFLEKRSGGVCEAIDSRTGLRCIEDRTYEGGSVLQVDHIDGVWYNNTPENVRLICPTCHVLTGTWGRRNMGSGKGRTWKAEYDQFKLKN